MYRKLSIGLLVLAVLSTALILSGCRTLLTPAETSETAPAPVEVFEPGGVDDPNVFVDSGLFQAALLQTLAARDTLKLQNWMGEPFFTGVWRSDLSKTLPINAIKMLLTDQLAEGVALTLVEGADLQALLGGIDPLSLLPGGTGVTQAFLVSGWGKDGADEALLFVAQGADNSLKWQGWMEVKGGFSGSRLGGLQPYTSEALGYSVFLPAGYSLTVQEEGTIAVFGKLEGNHPGGAWISAEPANGRTAQQAVDAAITELGAGFNIPPATAVNIEGVEALVITGMPGQDSTRHLFMVGGDRLYHIVFTPDDPELGEPYLQMKDVYAMIVNTFHFLP